MRKERNRRIFLFIFIFAMCFVSVHAELLMKESFDREVGDLSVGHFNNMGSDRSNWWYEQSEQIQSEKIQVADTNLTFDNYQTTPFGKAVAIKSNLNTNKDIRQFETVNTGSIYYSLLFNVHALTDNATPDHLVSFYGDGKRYARLRIVNNFSKGTFQLGISKFNETNARMYGEELSLNTTYLAIVRYDFVEGKKNDQVFLWINPAQTDELSPLLECVQDSLGEGVNNQEGANNQDDASYINCFYLRTAVQLPSSVTIDEVRVSDYWDDLFENKPEGPQIITTPNIDFGTVYTGDTYTEEFEVKTANLTENVYLAVKNSELRLSRTEVTVNDSAVLNLTLTPGEEGQHLDTIVLQSSGLKKKIPVSWVTKAVQICPTIRSVKETFENAEDGLFRYTGEAIITRDSSIVEYGPQMYMYRIFIQDSTGALCVDDTTLIWRSFRNGDKITNFVAKATKTQEGIVYASSCSKPEIISSGNSIEPRIITLAQLKQNPLPYLFTLVKVEYVNFETTDKTFKSGEYVIRQGNDTARVRIMEDGLILERKPIPQPAHVCGFVINIQGTLIQPTQLSHIEDKEVHLLRNAGFEKYSESTDENGDTLVTYDNWSLQGQKGVDTENNALEGKNAFSTEEDLPKDINLYQSVNLADYPDGTKFKIRICYKTNDADMSDGDFSFNSYWVSSDLQPLDHDADILNFNLAENEKWDTVTLYTTKPQGAASFVFNFLIKANTSVLIDDLDVDEETPDTFLYVSPVNPPAVEAFVNETVPVSVLTVRQQGLVNPVTLEITGEDKDMFLLNKDAVTLPYEDVQVLYRPTKAGNHTAVLVVSQNDGNTPETRYEQRITLNGAAIDTTQPKIIISKSQLTLTCQVRTRVKDTISVSSVKCIDNVYVDIDNTEGQAFEINEGVLSKNTRTRTIITFKPQQVGTYRATVTWTSLGADTVRMEVIGRASGNGITIDYDTAFVWNTANPLEQLNETFDMGSVYQDKTIRINRWQNVVTKGQRAWWGYATQSGAVARATGIYTSDSTSEECEMWLVTPPLKYNTPYAKIFSFEIMAEAIGENQNGALQLYYIDPTNQQNPIMQHITKVDDSIPGGSVSVGQWKKVTLNLEQDSMPDVFYMAFRYTDRTGQNAFAYQADNVQWGSVQSELPAYKNDNEKQNVRLFLHNGILYIKRNDRIYTVQGTLVK